jgi:flavin-dependent dehydrogenase
VSEDFAEETIRNKIHIFSTDNPKIKYIAFTPKGKFITVTAIGENVKRVDLENSLKEDAISSYLPANYAYKCHCHPRIPINVARNPFSDRFVIVGDAAASRYLKNGIESAFFTAKWAAATAVHHGVSSEDFKRNYYSVCRRVFYYDNIFGKILFGMYDLFSSSSIISRVNINMLMEERRKNQDSKILSLIFWHLFTGDAPYSHILRESCRPKLFLNFFKELLRSNKARRV